jgi:hypothetical protein
MVNLYIFALINMTLYKVDFKRWPALICLLLGMWGAKSQIVLNEFVADNFASYKDSFDSYHPWLELFNTSDKKQSLKNWRIDVDGMQEHFSLPDVSVNENSHILIVFSGKNRVFNGELHTDFKLTHLHSTFRLLGPDLIERDRIRHTKPEPDLSIGKFRDTGSHMLLSFPTPNRSNLPAEVYTQKDQLLIMSPFGGFYPQDSVLIDFYLISDNAKVYYTLDGSDPTPENGILFQSPFYLKHTHIPATRLSLIQTGGDVTQRGQLYQWSPPKKGIRKACIVKAAAFQHSVQVSKTVFGTFFIGQNSTPYPVNVLSCLVSEEDYFGNQRGIFVPGHFRDNNTQPFFFTEGGNYNEIGPEWERPMNASIFNIEGNIEWQMNVGARVHGYASRNYPQKSFRLYARDMYDTDRLDYPFFPSRSFKKYKHVLFRNSGQDITRTFFADALSCSFYENMDVDYQLHQPYVHFINGEYWGIMNVRDRINERFLEYTHNGVNRHLIMMGGVAENHEDAGIPQYRQLLDFMSENDMNTPASFSHVERHMDVSNFIDHQLAKIIIGAYDWPGNNVRIWCENKPKSKLRWITFDTDEAFSTPVNRNTLAHALEQDNDKWPNQAWSTLPLRKLLENDSFKHRFILRAQELIRSPFNTAQMSRHIDSFAKMYRPLMGEHIHRWNLIPDSLIWELHVDVMKHFASKRPCYLQKFFCEQFDLSQQQFLPELLCEELEEEPLFDMELLGNPGDHHLVVKVHMKQDFHIDIKVLTPEGKLVYNKRHTAYKGDNFFPIKVDHHPTTGLYYVMAHSRNLKVGKKWLRTPQN